MSKRDATHRNGTCRGVTNSPPVELRVRPAQPGDLEPLRFFFDTALRKDYFIRRGQLEEILDGPHHQVFVAEIDAILVGVAITTRGTRLVNALVHPAYRGIGIGRALLAATNVTEVRVKTDMSTGDPRPFYRACGFRATGTRNRRGNIELMRRPSPSPTNRDGRRAAGA